jgi:cytochrome P450
MELTCDAGARAELADIDLFDPARFGTGSQHPAFRTLRHEAPLWQQRTPGGVPFWSATRYRDVAAILMDDKAFSSESGTILAVAESGDSAGGKSINLLDQPRHAAVRLATMRTMSTRLMRERAEHIRGHIRQILAPALTGEPVDFAELMLALPMASVGETLGIPAEYWSAIPRWAMAGVAPEDSEYLVGTVGDTLKNAHYQLFEMFSNLVAQRRRRPADDAISALLEVRYPERKLTDFEILVNCYSLAMGSITTTPHTASQTVLALAQRPEQWQRLRRDPSLVGGALEEALRWSSPTNHLLRKVRHPVEVAGHRFEPGELVAAWVASANWDETVFDEPAQFRVDRSPNPHLAWGIGPHRCVGAPAAQLALSLLLAELVRDVETLELCGPVTHLHSNFINGITHLPVRLHPAPVAPRSS